MHCEQYIHSSSAFSLGREPAFIPQFAVHLSRNYSHCLHKEHRTIALEKNWLGNTRFVCDGMALNHQTGCHYEMLHHQEENYYNSRESRSFLAHIHNSTKNPLLQTNWNMMEYS